MHLKLQVSVNRLAVALFLLSATTSAVAADYECHSQPALLPHQQWDLSMPADNDSLYVRARAAIDHWSHDRELHALAAAMLEELILREPDNTRGYVEYARLMMKTGTVQRLTMDPFAYEIAREALRRAFLLDSESPNAWLALGELEMHRTTDEIQYGNSDAQEFALTQALRFGADTHEIDFARARLAELRYELSAAAQHARQALEAPNRATSAQLAELHAFAAQVARRDHRPEDARQEISAAIRLEPDNPYHWVDLSALWLEEHGDTRQAIAAARAALCISPVRGAERALALALYNDWAFDNVSAESPDSTDPRLMEAYSLYDDLAWVMGYSAEHAPLSSLVDVFVAVGVDPNIGDPVDGDTALENAVLRSEPESAQRLLAAGADANTRSSDMSVLALAVAKDDLQMVGLLLKEGADVNLQWPEGTALLTAVSSGNTVMVRYLLAAGADPNLGDDIGGTPLQGAIFLEHRERTDILRALLDAGANPHQTVSGDLTLLEFAEDHADPEVATLLRQASDAGR